MQECLTLPGAFLTSAYSRYYLYLSHMKLNIYTFLAICLMGTFAACKKDSTTETYDAAKYMAADTTAIRAYIKANNIPAIKLPSGLFYQIIAPGSGNVNYTNATSITCEYEGKLLNGSVFDTTTGKGPATFTLSGLIVGWQIGVPLIQKGGKVRLLIPSYYGYRNSVKDGIPVNSPLDFTITLNDVN